VKLAAAAGAAFVARPDPAAGAVLLFGEDAMRVALKRQDLIAALLGAGGATDMRLTRLDADLLRRDPAAAADAAQSSGFFAAEGPRAVLVEGASDAHLRGIETVMLSDGCAAFDKAVHEATLVSLATVTRQETCAGVLALIEGAK